MLALLGGVILKGDHSFMIIDQMAKVNGVSTFSCLYTLLNDYEEICLQVLCHSKKMEHLAPQFVSMMENYRRLGKKLPQLFYTDNVVGDQRFLKEVIPSLTKDVVPVEPTKQKTFQNSDMTHLLKEVKRSFPENIDIIVFDDTRSIDDACQVILNQLNTEDQLSIGFDCEWVKSSAISLIQVAYNRSVYLFRVHTFDVASFPKNLRDIISSERIRKIGSNIQSDFTWLARGFECEIPKTEGKIDLGYYCKAKV